MRFQVTWSSFAAAVFLSASMFAECIDFTEAPRHVGASRCISGRVAKITRLDSGTTFLNFCEDYRTCPFQVVVFRGDLAHVGDVRQLEGRVIEIHGEIKEYDRHAEIILRDVHQLHGDAAMIPPLPKGFDVENKGRFSAGSAKRKKTKKTAGRSKAQAAPIQIEDPEMQ